MHQKVLLLFFVKIFLLIPSNNNSTGKPQLYTERYKANVIYVILYMV